MLCHRGGIWIARHLTFRIEDDLAEALAAMGEDTKKDRSYLINFALRMLCEAGGPDGLFQQKTRAIMMESLGFDDTQGLLDIIDARVAILAGMEPGSLGQADGPFLMIADVAQEKMEVMQRDSARRDVPQASNDPVTSALEFIRSELESGTEPLLDQVAVHVSMDTNPLAVVLAARGIKTSRVRRGGQRRQYFLKDKLPLVREALGIK